MTDTNEIRALKASLRGTLNAAAALTALQERVDALDDHGDVSGEALEELGSVTSGLAVGAQALRGLVVTMRSRRATSTE
ncbi:MAG TPA: hypothetical protein VNJ03_02505 [Vicinamibacterales bacterium]|jgi:hypothetical protein|nr:hypothetical protein [Vicinamibacterales bacterium]